MMFLPVSLRAPASVRACVHMRAGAVCDLEGLPCGSPPHPISRITPARTAGVSWIRLCFVMCKKASLGDVPTTRLKVVRLVGGGGGLKGDGGSAGEGSERNGGSLG